MENYSQLYNHLYFDSCELSSPTAAASSSASSVERRVNFSDEDLMLASSHPKKRAGRMKFKETRHPIYRGVRKRNSGKWVCEVRQPNNKSRIWLGTYQTPDMAARAHDVAALALRGRSACLNFADSTWRLPIPASSDVKDIQRAAAEAAEMFGPEEESNDVMSSDSTCASFSQNLFYDEGMPELLANMAEGLMLVPPPHRAGNYEYDVKFSDDMLLWSFSV